MTRVIKHSWEETDKQAFDRLLDASAKHSVQQRSQWLDQYCQAYQQRGDDLVLSVVDGDELIGCLPMRVEYKRATRFFKIRKLIDLGSGPADFFYITAAPGKEEIVASALASWFNDNKQEWEQLELSFIPRDCKVAYLFADKLAEAFPDTETDISRLYYSLDTSGSWEEYYTPEFNKKIRDIRGRLNRVKRNEITLHYDEISSGIVQFLDDFIEVFNKRREEKSEKSSFEEPEKIKLIRGILPYYEKMGWVKLSVLKDGEGNTWAYQLDLVHNRTWYHYSPAFDKEYAWYSPSKLLLYHTLQKCFADAGIDEFNFMRGESHYKTQFTEYHEPYLKITAGNEQSVRRKGWVAATRLLTFGRNMKG
ncbi:GNAT family N-acetyltransferase [Roseivirga sp. BDSF3-8]|uniref:GNAT family N-acetyltransferase n=1 Tax=Roseivirga sp. BDSF3-8 TaxID=3241598 RepID=UPI0035320418